MKQLLLLLILVIPAFASGFFVETLDEQQNSNNLLVFRARVTNNLYPVADGVLKFCLKKNPQKNLVVEKYYVQNANVVLHDIDSANVCVDIEMGFVPMGVFPNTSGFSVGVHYSDWSNRDKTQDYSNPKGASFLKAENVSFYDGDFMIYGAIPSKFDAARYDAKFVLIQPESYLKQSAFVELKNNGNRELIANKLEVQVNNQRFRILKNNLAVGSSARVILDSICPQSMNNVGELLLLYDSIPVDYLVWGKKGSLSKKAVEWGLWNDEFFFLKTKRDPIVFMEDGYTKGDFFYRKNTEILGGDGWRFYTKENRMTYDYLLPSPISISMPSGMSVFLDENEPLSFAWSLVDSAKVYRLTVFSKDSSVVHEKDYYGNVANVSLPSGKYFWNVLAARSTSDFEANPGATLLIPLNEIIILPLKRFTIKKILNVTSLDTRRDTKLLNVAWSDQILKHPWDREAPPLDPESRPYDSEEKTRCWAVGILMMNHYFYRSRHGIDGDLTLDEVLVEVGMHFAALHNGMHPSLAALRSGANLLNDYAHYDGITYGLKWALKIPEPTLINVKNEANLHRVAARYIENDMPLYVVQCNGPMVDGSCGYSTHAMVVDGYAIHDNGTWALHFLNVDNYGSSQWRTFGSDDWNYILHYYEYEKPNGDVKISDPLVHSDSDQDGVMDFDEKYRFDSDMKLHDTDFDGVWDKEEIYSYTIREKMDFDGTGRIADFYADIDHDSKRAENDSDSDGDKLSDGEEDLNGNGMLDEGETDPYIVDNIPSTQVNEIPSNIALYSLDYLRINDGVQCQSLDDALGMNYCDAVSESANSWAVVVGTKVRWGNIYTKGMTTLRNNADIDAIMYYGSDFYPYAPVLQEGALCRKITYMDRWPLPLLNIESIVSTSSRDLLIRNGEKVSLLSGINSYRSIKVEAGGELVFVPGEFITEDLQIESGARISFANPGRKTILHVKNTIIWRGKFDAKANLVSIARGFKLYYYGTERFFVEGSWGGTIIAPNAKLILGQTQYKSLYGQFLGNGLAVHQYSRMINVPFNPLNSGFLAYKE